MLPQGKKLVLCFEIGKMRIWFYVSLEQKKKVFDVLFVPTNRQFRMANVVADHNDLLTQRGPIKMSKFRANIFLMQTTSNYLYA